MSSRSKSFSRPQMQAWHNGKHWVGWFYDELYRFNVHVIWEVKGRELERYFKRQFKVDYQPGPDTWFARCVEWVANNGARGTHVIALRKWDASANTIAALTHECFHATEQVLAQRGIAHSDPTSEPYAYLLESIVRRCLQIIESAKQSRKTKA